MKILCAAAGAALLACSLTGYSQTEVACGQTLQAAMHSDGALAIDSRPAGLTVVGTDQLTMRVTCTADDPESMECVRLKLSGSGNGSTLTIQGGETHHGGVEVRIEVPHRTSIQVTMGAGQVTVENLDGNKEISLYAGQVTISSPQGWDYRSVDASVDIGEVNAQAFGADKGGFFRQFTRQNANGEYRLYAHVMTGEIDLLGARQGSAAD
ncbi:MAG TPA: hypothetical protein VME18_06120 [Acidobacteriaceae bacterium]|nr:hypothetical protein [Acidobacteriaceae bacterium]